MAYFTISNEAVKTVGKSAFIPYPGKKRLRGVFCCSIALNSSEKGVRFSRQPKFVQLKVIGGKQKPERRFEFSFGLLNKFVPCDKTIYKGVRDMVSLGIESTIIYDHFNAGLSQAGSVSTYLLGKRDAYIRNPL
jgi:hypothetical protein